LINWFCYFVVLWLKFNFFFLSASAFNYSSYDICRFLEFELMVSLSRVIKLKKGGQRPNFFFQLVLTLKYKRSKSAYFKKLGFLSLSSTEHTLFIDLFGLGSSLNDGAFLNTAAKKYISKFV